jgi:signal peptidase II
VTVVTLLDFITKAYISSTMYLHESFVVIGGFLNITYVRNPGAAFSFLADAPAVFRLVFFVTVTVLAIILILTYIAKSKLEEPLMTFGLSLIMSGAVGNLWRGYRFY